MHTLCEVGGALWRLSALWGHCGPRWEVVGGTVEAEKHCVRLTHLQLAGDPGEMIEYHCCRTCPRIIFVCSFLSSKSLNYSITLLPGL